MFVHARGKERNALKRITYILLTFPILTTTFIDREIQALQECGFQVQVVSLRRPRGLLSGYQERLVQSTRYLYPANFLMQCFAHLFFLFTRPRQYTATLFYLMTSPHPTLLSHRRTLRHFHQGVATAYQLRKDPGEHIHAHFLNQSAAIALVTSRLLDVPYSVTVHASGDFYASPLLIREKLAGAKFIATCTRYNRDRLAEIGRGMFADRLLVNYHGLDFTRFQRRTRKPLDNAVILSVGQLWERKGLIYLVRACGMLKQQGLGFCCRIIGEGPERPVLEAEIRALGLEDDVELTGALPQEAVLEQYDKATIFALPAVQAASGDQDGIPNVLLEAMAMELPVVSTNRAAIAEVVAAGENGLLVPPGDFHELAGALGRLLANRPYADRLGRAGRRTVLEMFDARKNIQLLAKAFLE